MKRKIAAVLTAVALTGGLSAVAAPAQALKTSSGGCTMTVTSRAFDTLVDTNCSWGQARTQYRTATGAAGTAYGAQAKSSNTGDVPSWMKTQSAGRMSPIPSYWWVA